MTENTRGFNGTTAYNTKIIRSKYKKEVWFYDEPIGRDYITRSDTERRTFDQLSPREKIKSLKKRAAAARNQRWNIIRLVDANFVGTTYSHGHQLTDKFLTLTFNTPLKLADIKQANHLFWLFINRLRRYLDHNFGLPLKYLAAWEIQPHSKRIHYHLIIFQCPFISTAKLTKIWKNGYIWIEKINKVGHAKVGSYISKYMTKNIGNFDPSLVKVKKFFKSQNLEQPDTRRYLLDPADFDPQQKDLAYSSEYLQTRYDVLKENFYQIRVRYFVYEDDENQKD